MYRLICILVPVALLSVTGCGPAKGTTQLEQTDEVITTLTTEGKESTGSASGGSGTSLSQ